MMHPINLGTQQLLDVVVHCTVVDSTENMTNV